MDGITVETGNLPESVIRNLHISYDTDDIEDSSDTVVYPYTDISSSVEVASENADTGSSGVTVGSSIALVVIVVVLALHILFRKKG